jgi:GT2 family glycosyltransferase
VEDFKYKIVSTAMQLKILAIIVVYNNEKITLDFLNSLRKITIPNECNFELLIIDNGSTIVFKEELQLNFMSSIIRVEKNIGFGGGANIGINNAIDIGADYIWLLNNDVVLPKDCLTNSLNSLTDYDALTFSMNNPDGTIETSGLGNISFLTGRGVKSSSQSFISDNSYFNFASIIISSEVLREVGGFDSDNFFLYWEDVDLSFRIMKKNYKVGLVNSDIVHYSGSTNNNYSFLTAYHYNKSAVVFYKKHGVKIFGVIPPLIACHLRFIKRLLSLQIIKAIGTLAGGYSGLFHIVQ